MSRVKIPPISERFGDLPAGLTTPEAAGWGYVKKQVFRSYLIGTGGSEVVLEGAGEIAVYSDYPFEIAINDPSRYMTILTEAHFSGRINRIFLRMLLVNSIGRVVVYSSRPNLGRNFQRENPALMQPLVLPLSVVTWGTSDTSDSITITIPDGVGLNEALYVYEIVAQRTIGSIETVQFLESETGVNLPVFRHRSENPTENLVYIPSQPIRISSSGSFNFTGSTEITGTANVSITAVRI